MSEHRGEYAVEQGGLRISVRVESGRLKTSWEGKSVGREPGKFLLPLLRQWMDEADKSGLTLVLDMSRLEYMNSSTVTPLILAVQQMNQRKLPMEIQYKGSLKWQKLSFSAFRVFVGPGRQFQLTDLG